MRSFKDNTPSRAQFAPPPADYVDARVLGAGAAERHTIPTSPIKPKYVVFSGDGNFYALFGDSTVTAAIPAADVTDGTAPELNPEAREIPAGATHISLIASAATVITMSFYG